MSKYIRTLIVCFDTELHLKEVPLFRGAVLESLGHDANLLFHNHTGENSFRYSYPLIQYKRINGYATIVCIEKGVDLIGSFLRETNGKLRIGDRVVECTIKRILPARLLVQTWESTFDYHISQWLPFNSKNYQLYQNMEGLIERTTFLENILKGNLLSMLKGLDIHIDKEIIVKIKHISDSHLITYKGVKLMAFHADFACNLSIPNNLGIGKNASIGFGTIHQKRKDIIEKNNS